MFCFENYIWFSLLFLRCLCNRHYGCCASTLITKFKFMMMIIIIIIREVTANRPDIIIKNKKEKTCTLIDVAIPADRNVVQKDAEKKLKYKSLCTEIQWMWNLKCTIIPVIIGATGIVMRSLRKNLEAIPGKHLIDSLQKTAILQTKHIIWKVLQCEAWSLSGGDHRWFKRSTRKKRPVTRDIHIIIIIIIIIIIMQCTVTIPYLCFKTIYRSHLQTTRNPKEITAQLKLTETISFFGTLSIV